MQLQELQLHVRLSAGGDQVQVLVAHLRLLSFGILERAERDEVAFAPIIFNQENHFWQKIPRLHLTVGLLSRLNTHYSSLITHYLHLTTPTHTPQFVGQCPR